MQYFVCNIFSITIEIEWNQHQIALFVLCLKFLLPRYYMIKLVLMLMLFSLVFQSNSYYVLLCHCSADFLLTANILYWTHMHLSRKQNQKTKQQQQNKKFEVKMCTTYRMYFTRNVWKRWHSSLSYHIPLKILSTANVLLSKLFTVSCDHVKLWTYGYTLIA